MDLNVNININNSFNKKDNLNPEEKGFLSTKSPDIKNFVMTNSQSVSSITAGSFIKNDSFTKDSLHKRLITRDIFVGTSSALIATIISYFIFGIK